jgi:hypothetical protein
MDPYLEGDLWTTVHAQLAAEIVRQLAPKLRPRYVPLMQQRFVTDTPDDVAVESTDLYPDVGIARARKRSAKLPAVMVEAPLTLATIMPARVPHSWVEIRDTQKRRLVTVIEFLSPTNKRGEGRQEYIAKRQKILGSTAHLLEIDLLRRGKRVPMRQTLPSAPYFVFLSRAGKRPQTQVWPIPIDQPLPTVPVPLLPPDPDVPLDLQKALDNVYDLCAYDLAVNYSRNPEVRLPSNYASWAAQCLRAAGVRSSKLGRERNA